MTGLQLYFVLQLDAFISLFGWLIPICVLSGVMMVLIGGILRDDNTSDSNIYRVGFSLQKNSWKLIFPMLFFMFMYVLIPSTKTALAIWTVPTIVNNEKVSALPEKLVNVLDKYLTELGE